MNPPMRESYKGKKHWYEWCKKYFCTWHCTDDVVGVTVPRAHFRLAILVISTKIFLSAFKFKIDKENGCERY